MAYVHMVSKYLVDNYGCSAMMKQHMNTHIRLVFIAYDRSE